MKKDERKMRGALNGFSVPEFDRERMEQTVLLAKQAYREGVVSERIGFRQFLSMQFRFTGRWVWGGQAALLLAFFALFYGGGFGRTDLRPVYLLFSALAPLIAFVAFPELVKSCSHNMEEIEACTRFSMRKLLGARMLVLGLADLCSLTVILAVSSAGAAVPVLRMILYLFVPFNLTCCACLTVLDRVKSRYDGYYCGAVCVLCMAAFCRLSTVDQYYETAAVWVWAVLFLISTVYFVAEVVRVFHGFSLGSFPGEKLSVQWR